MEHLCMRQLVSPHRPHHLCGMPAQLRYHGAVCNLRPREDDGSGVRDLHSGQIQGALAGKGHGGGRAFSGGDPGLGGGAFSRDGDGRAGLHSTATCPIQAAQPLGGSFSAPT